MKNNLKLIILLLLLLSMLLASCVPNNTTSTTDNSIISDIESKNDNSVDNSTDESTPFSETESSDVDTSEESIPEISDVSAAEESDDYSDIVWVGGYSPSDYYDFVNVNYYKSRAFRSFVNILWEVYDKNVVSEALDVVYDGIHADPERFYKEVQLPNVYFAVKKLGMTKEEFEKANAKYASRFEEQEDQEDIVHYIFTQEEIEALFSGDEDLVKKVLKHDTTFYYKGRLYTLHDVMGIMLLYGNFNQYKFYGQYNENGELLEYLQYMERVLESGKYDETYGFVHRDRDTGEIVEEKEYFIKDIYLQLIRFGIKVLTNTLYE